MSSSHPCHSFSAVKLQQRSKQRGVGQTSVEQQAEGPGHALMLGQELAHALGLLSGLKDRTKTWKANGIEPKYK